MSWASRASVCLLIWSLSVSSTWAQSQSASAVPSSTSSPVESALKAAVEKYFVFYAAEDLDGVMSLWSAKSPDYASLKQNLQREVATEDFSFSNPVISRVTVESEKASLRVVTNLTAINRKSNQKREQQMVRNFAFVKEDGQWKVWRSTAAEDDLAEALAGAKPEAERGRLLIEEKDLVTAELVRALGSVGDRTYNQGRYAQAIAIYAQTLSIAEQIGDQRGMVSTLNDLGNVHRSKGDYAQALDYYQKSLAIGEALGDRSRIAATLGLIGTVHSFQSNYALALEFFQRSLEMSEALEDKWKIAFALSQIGGVHHALSDYALALEYYEKSLAIQESLGDKAGIANTQNSIGRIHSIQGNYARALEYYQKSLAMNEILGIKIRIASALNNIGVVYRLQGNYAQALEFYQKSLAMKEETGNKNSIASTLNNLGVLYRLQGDYAQALEYFQKSLEMCQELGYKSGIALTLNNIGFVHLIQGNFKEAEERLQKSLAMWETIGDKSGIASCLGNLGKIYVKQGHPAQALELVDRAAALARQIGETETVWKLLLTVGDAYRSLNQRAQAQRAFEEAISIAESLRAQVAGGEQEQQRFFESKVSPYQAMVDLLVAQGSPPEALTFAERAKARSLLDVLQQGRFGIQKAMTAEERQQESRLKTELIRLNTQLVGASQSDKPDPHRIGEIKPRLEKARLNYEAFQTSLYAAHPELKVKRGEAPIIKSQELAALLPDAASALIEFVVADDRTYLFVVSKAAANVQTDIRVYAVAIKRDDLAKQIESFRNQLAGRDLGFRAAAVKLYDLLLKPAEAQLQGKTNLIIAPDDKLWDLPFQALLAGTNRFLLENAAIAYAPSLTALREMTRRPKHQGADAASTTLLALGNPLLGKETVNRAALTLRDEKLDPLPEAEQEVKALRQLYGTSRSKVYIGAEAREDRVKSEASQARVLHFAAHGMLNNASPMYSHLALAPGSANEDGLLEAWELIQLDLKADLAVLSACETSRGRIGAGEGMIGLSWAMFIAGVPSIVVSQWKVESAGTRDLMVNFHRALISQPPPGKAKPTKTECLRQAALKLMKNPATRHPFYWAGFVLVGDGR